MPNLQNKVAIVTGAASGIGQATAIYFASLGCNVSLVDINPEKLEETRQQCLQKGLSDKRVLIQTGDLTKQSVREDVINETVNHFGKLDILVNCAGIARLNQTLETTDMRQFDHIIDVNLKVAFALSQLSVPYLKLTKGSIVNVSSRLSTKPELFSLPYCVSKAGVDQLTRFSAKELAPFQIRVNSVNPDVTKTNIIQNMPGTTEETVDMMENAAIQGVALGRMALPIEIAKPIAFLASDDASFITGVNLLVDGGATL